MDRWFTNNGRPALLGALAAACARVDDEFQNAVRSEVDATAELKAELEFLRLRVTAVDRLEHQNKTLREELAALRKPGRFPQHPNQNTTSPARNQTTAKGELNPATPAATPLDEALNQPRSMTHNRVDVEGLSQPDLLLEYASLEARHEKLRGLYSDAIHANEQLKEQRKERTKTLTNWKEHAQKLSVQAQSRLVKIKKLKAELTAATGDAAEVSFTSDLPSDNEGTLGDTGRRPQNSHQLVARSLFGEPGLQSPVLAWEGNSPLVSEHEVPGSCPQDSTQSDPVDGGSEVAEEPSLPPLPDAGKESAEVNPVKEEPSSDVPVIVSERAVQKRKRSGEQLGQTPVATRVKTEHSSDPLVTEEQHHFMPHESLDFDAAAGRVTTPRKHRLTLAAPVTTPQCRHPDEPGPNKVPVLEYGDGLSRSSALRPLSVNTPFTRRTSSKKDSKKDAEITPFHAHIASIAEDGEDFGLPKSTTRRSKKTRRLEDLLNTSTPGRVAIALPTDVRQEDIPTTGLSQLLVPPRSLPFGKEGRERVGNSSKAAETPTTGKSNGSASTRRPKQRPLDAPPKSKASSRIIPLRKQAKWNLHMGDFKVNPKHNDGHDYAFTEVVRNKDQRASMPGALLGAAGEEFRKQARFDLDHTGLLEYQNLLESYLGDECHRLGSMTKKEKDQMWVEAKAQEIADKAGRHRERYPRMPSPPGHWNVDFPSTQEERDFKMEAERKEREIVEERYREAMKPNGRWLFRDE